MRRWFPVIPIGGVLLFTAAVYSRLPDPMVTHWTFHGLPDSHASRVVAAWLGPVVAVLLWAVLRGLPRIDPFRANYAKFQGTYDLAVAGVVTLIAVEHVATLAHALGWPMPDRTRLPTVAFGVLMVLLGNVMPRARRNWWFGVRTPWTLMSDTVWAKTHRAGGYMTAAAGAIILMAAVLPPEVRRVVVIACIMGVAIASVGYSYFAWRTEQRT